MEMEQRAVCSACGLRGGCGSAQLTGMIKPRRISVEVDCIEGVEPGDRVEVGIEESALLRGSATVYLLPLGALFAGASAVVAVGVENEFAIALGGCSGMTLGIIWARRWITRQMRGGSRNPLVCRRIAALPGVKPVRPIDGEFE